MIHGYIQDLDRYPDAIVKVFNRWGQLLLESDGPSYPNNDFNWDGVACWDLLLHN